MLQAGPGIPRWAVPFAPVCEAVAALLHPHGEVVLHDLGHDRIVAIHNAFSGHSVGDPSLIDDLPESVDGTGLIGPYEKVLPDGRRLTSVTATLRDQSARRRGLLCINLDRSPLDRVVDILTSFAAPVTPRPPGLFTRDWREQINLVVADFCRSRQVRLDRLGRSGRVEVVRLIEQQDLFAARHASEWVATALQVSRATVFALRREARR